MMVRVLDWQSKSSDVGVRRESIDECKKGSSLLLACSMVAVDI